MILVALVICILISTSSFAWGYRLAGYEEVVRWIIVLGFLWLVSLWRKWRWFSVATVFFFFSLAVIGIWFEFTPGLMFGGAAFGIFAWNLIEFQQKLRLLPAREDKEGMTRRHLIRIAILAAMAIGISLGLGIGT